MHVERRRIRGAGPTESSFAAPEFNAALEVRVEDPHVFSLPKVSGRGQASPRLLVIGGVDKGVVGEEGKCEKCQYS